MINAHLAEFRARCARAIEDHEQQVEELNARYGAPFGWRRPGAKTKKQRLADLDAEVRRMSEIYR